MSGLSKNGGDESLAELQAVLGELDRRVQDIRLLVAQAVALLSGLRTGVHSDAWAGRWDAEDLAKIKQEQVRRRMEERERLQLRTNALVILDDSKSGDRKPQIIVDGQEAVVGFKQFAVIKILAQRMLSVPTLGGLGYVTAAEIADRLSEMALEQEERYGDERDDLWRLSRRREEHRCGDEDDRWYPTQQVVLHLISRLRGTMPILRQLIETGDGGKGYRLSTHPDNVAIVAGDRNVM